jgi:hypothetical protein
MKITKEELKYHTVKLSYLENLHVYFSNDDGLFVDCYCWDFRDVAFLNEEYSCYELLKMFDCIEVTQRGDSLYSEGW